MRKLVTLVYVLKNSYIYCTEKYVQTIYLSCPLLKHLSCVVCRYLVNKLVPKTKILQDRKRLP